MSGGWYGRGWLVFCFCREEQEGLMDLPDDVAQAEGYE